MLNKKFT